MSQENVEALRRGYEWATARLELIPEFFAPDFEADMSEAGPETVVVRGVEAAQESLREYWEMFDDFHIELEEVIHADEGLVVTAVRDGGRMRGSDAEVWNRFFHVWTFADGKVARLSIHTDRSRALEAAGLSE